MGGRGSRLKKTERNEKESYKIEGAESSHTRKKLLYNVTMRIISAIVKIKREQDSLVPSNRIQVNA